jgi:hypothetical protein
MGMRAQYGMAVNRKKSLANENARYNIAATMSGALM